MAAHREYAVPMRGAVLQLGRAAKVMGILNVTPDSFSDGGRFNAIDAAVMHAHAMVADGADVIDIGGESTRPGASEIGVQQELDRVIPVIQALAEHSAPISIDTYKAVVADQAIQAGAKIINDVHGLQRDPEIADVAALYGVPMIVMHWDEARDRSKDPIDEVKRWFDRSLAIADKAGVQRDKVQLDVGFGFAKSISENYELLRRLGEVTSLGYPVVVGTSRKSMIGRLLDVPMDQRVAGTVATNVLAYAAGAHLFRVHDVRPNRDALRVAEATLYGPPADGAQV